MLSNEQIIERAPSVGATTPHPDVSAKYEFINTMDVISALKKEKWYVVSAEESRAHSEANQGYQKHLIRLRHRDAITRGDNETIESILTNSHNRQYPCKFLTGVFRLVCSNGLIVGTQYPGYEMKHIFHTQSELIENALKIVADSDQMLKHIGTMKRFKDFDQKEFARGALKIMYGDEPPMGPSAILTRNRSYDNATNLWTVLNVVQENYIKGETLQKNGRVTRPITNINKQVRVNRELWDLAETMMN